MKSEKEVLLLVKLLRIDKNFVGCKADFEKELGICSKNKEFRGWFDELVSSGDMEFVEMKKVIGGEIPTHKTNRKNLIKRLKAIPDWKDYEVVGVETGTVIGL